MKQFRLSHTPHRSDIARSVRHDLVVCPACGSPHHKHDRCPICALTAAFGN